MLQSSNSNCQNFEILNKKEKSKCKLTIETCSNTVLCLYMVFLNNGLMTGLLVIEKLN